MPRAQNIAEDGTSFRNAQRRLGLRLRHASSDRAAVDRPPCPQRRAPPSRCPCGVGRERAVPALLHARLQRPPRPGPPCSPRGAPHPGRARLRPPTAFPCGPHVPSCDSELLRPMPGPFPLSATLRAARTVPSRPGNLCVSTRHPRPPLPPASPLPRGAPVAPTTQQPHVGQGCVWVCVFCIVFKRQRRRPVVPRGPTALPAAHPVAWRLAAWRAATGPRASDRPGVVRGHAGTRRQRHGGAGTRRGRLPA